MIHHLPLLLNQNQIESHTYIHRDIYDLDFEINSFVVEW